MDKNKFKRPSITADGSPRASVDFIDLRTLWFNTGTLCNLSCSNCYIESSPLNDRLVYLSCEDVAPYLKEIQENKWSTATIGLTGGEPFLNPHIMDILKLCLKSGFEVLVLTNANRVIKKHQLGLLQLKERHGDKLKLRISLDHYSEEAHEKERGPNTFKRTMEQVAWLFKNGFDISVAGRSLFQESQEAARDGYAKLLESHNVRLDLNAKLVIFPEMKADREVSEITTACWDILKKSPDDQMCASERMIVKPKGAKGTQVMPCTLLAYDDQFNLGSTLATASKKVWLNHPFCAQFCVLGGASCSNAK